ncbi:MAG: 3'(2'),5'-bisphosphate nucleotidase CysQ [Pseudomonadota bacterium]
MEDLKHLADIASPLAVLAGNEIMAVRAGGFAVDTKGDGSPVTVADQRAEHLILQGLQDAHITIPVIAEEQMSNGIVPDISCSTFLCIDPLDGTKEFTKGGEDFTVNIALVKDKAPVLGIIYIPATRVLYVGFQSDSDGTKTASTVYSVSIGEDGTEGVRTPISCRAITSPPAIVASRSHMNEETERFLKQYPDSKTVNVGSSLKFCRIAEGNADLYPRFSPTMEWDTAAGDAILRAAGGMTFGIDGQPFGYQKPEFRNGHFMATGTATADPNLWG